ncbi:S24 family peptidase [Cycloclasticus pugetii]|uniref:S24 family peptidase n=1 Tax=Cycloclasticus pugetii TaxID=34068 RepID=UPI003A8E15DE
MEENVAFAISNVNSQSDISGRYTSGMDRAKRLREIIDTRFGGNQADFARHIGKSPALVWQYLSGHRMIGEKFAREVERKIILPKGWMDAPPYTEVKPNSRKGSEHDELEFFGHMDAWDSTTPLDEDEVELPLFREVELAAGGGATQVIENRGAKLRFAKSTLSRAGVPAEAAACAFVRGNSMEPVMPDGTCVGVNTADKAIKDGEIYAIDHGGMLRVKYLHRRPGGGIKIVSQNASEHPVEEVTVEEMAQGVRVIGRVFWWSVLR